MRPRRRAESTSLWAPIDGLQPAERIARARRHIAEGKEQARARGSAVATAVLETLDATRPHRKGERLHVEAAIRTALSICEAHRWDHLMSVTVTS